MHDRERQARIDAPAIDKDRARPALAAVAALFCPGQAEGLAQRIQQAYSRLEFERVFLAVDVERERARRNCTGLRLGRVGKCHWYLCRTGDHQAGLDEAAARRVIRGIEWWGSRFGHGRLPDRVGRTSDSLSMPGAHGRFGDSHKRASVPRRANVRISPHVLAMDAWLCYSTRPASAMARKVNEIK
jgi:hypothetical protein